LPGMSDTNIATTVTLNNGVEMPLFGLGTYRAGPGCGTEDAVIQALEAGYRLIDTASYYRNEREIGAAIKRSGVPRDEIFVTTKLWNDDHGFESTIGACRRSMAELDLEYLDQYLIHWPVSASRIESWRAMEALLAQGLCRSVGVSNYNVGHLEELLAKAELCPAVNQVEFHVFLFQEELLECCRANGIVLVAFSPLARTRGFSDSRVQEVASHYEKTPAQIYLRWALQHHVAVIPKSSSRERILENADVFDFSISGEDMRILDSLDGEIRVSRDPAEES